MMSTSLTSAGDSTSQRGRWPIAFLLAFGVIVNFFDRINLAVSQEALHASFGLTLISFGYLSSAFSWSYAAMQLPAGLLLDRLGVRRVGRISTLLWSVASFCAALSTGLVGLFAARLLLGVAESPTFPANAKAIGQWFPERQRRLAMAITDAAAKLSSAIGIPLIGLLLLHFGWRWSFAATGFISLFYFALFYSVYREPEKGLPPPSVPLAFRAQANTQHSIAARAPRESWAKYLLRLWRRTSVRYLLRQPK